jgi:hypothetical protein
MALPVGNFKTVAPRKLAGVVMIRAAFAVLFLALAPLAVARDGKKPNLYPLQLGNRWEYEFFEQSEPETKVEIVTEVTASETKGGKITATLSATAPGMKAKGEQVTADERGVYRNGVSGLTADREFPIIKYPVKSGDTWKETVRINDLDIEMKFVVGEVEEVKVPAGKFKATPFHATGKMKGGEMRTTKWFVEGVGPVKETLTAGGRTYTMELKKFTPGK